MLELRLHFGKITIGDDMEVSLDGRRLPSKPRLLKDLAKVLMAPQVLDMIGGSTVLYKMCRDAVHEKDAPAFRKHAVRFDITVISPIALGDEYNKTLGHYHPEAAKGLTYPELYQVLSGQAIFLLQRQEGGRITEFRIMEANAGDAVLIPPNFGHVTVNPGDDLLVLSNLVSSSFESIYGDYISKRGAAYYVLKGKRVIPNPEYVQPPPPKRSGTRYPISKDLYSDFISCPRCFSFLNDPSAIADRFLI